MSLISEILNRKSLILNFAVTELKIKYRNSLLGFFWTLLEPLMYLTVIYLVMSNIMKIEIEHFEIYLLLGLIMWNMFQKATTSGLDSLVSKKIIGNPNLFSTRNNLHQYYISCLDNDIIRICYFRNFYGHFPIYSTNYYFVVTSNHITSSNFGIGIMFALINAQHQIS